MTRKIALIVIAILACAGLAACSTQTKELPDTAPPHSAPAVPGVGASPEVAPPAVPGGPGAGGDVAPAPEMKLPAYEGQVKKKWVEGSTEFDAIVSTSPCKADSDCTSTKYGNAPAKDADCTCAAPCTPYVVNKTEAARREAANKQHCDADDWYGPDCPAPDCGFIEFDRYRCKDGVCGGLALGKTQ